MTPNKNIPARILYFVKAEPVFSVALIAALISMIAVPPNPEYLGYIKWRTLGLLTMFMLCVQGLEKAGVLSRIAHILLGAASRRKSGGLKAIVVVLVALPYFFAMFITNDVSLLTFVPFAIMLLTSQKREDLIPLVLTLQTIAANAGSYLTPFGNPHNMYAYLLFDVQMGDFLAAQAPFTISLGVFLLACVFLFVRKPSGSNQEEQIASEDLISQHHPHADRASGLLFAALFCVSVLSVLKVLPVRYALPFICAIVLLRDRSLFAKVDWMLLGTFVCFFIFSSNLAAIPAISDVLNGAMAQHPFWITMGTSQVISNVPSCTLLAPFTTDWRALAVGANIGGLGSPVGSLASLITLGFYRRATNKGMGGFMKVFLGFNIVALALSCTIWFLLGW